MFGRFKRKSRQDDDRTALVLEAREMLNGMKRNWDMATHMTFAVVLANLWREFELEHGSPARFVELPDATKWAYLQSLMERSVELHNNLERLNSEKAAKGPLTDALCYWAASRFLGFYIVALIADDSEWEAELGPVLDDYMAKGYKISWGSYPLPGEERIDRSKQPDVQPLAHFMR